MALEKESATRLSLPQCAECQWCIQKCSKVVCPWFKLFGHTKCQCFVVSICGELLVLQEMLEMLYAQI